MTNEEKQMLAKTVQPLIDEALSGTIIQNTHEYEHSDHAPRWDTNSIFKFDWCCAVCGYEASEGEALILDKMVQLQKEHKAKQLRQQSQDCACHDCGLTWSESTGDTYCPRCDSENIKTEIFDDTV
jgi:predicted Zn-ribbon and HTH transcriptional regulator